MKKCTVYRRTTTGESQQVIAIKTYVYISVKLVFDPPTSAAVITSYENRLNKLEWRISHAADILNKPESEEGNIDE